MRRFAASETVSMEIVARGGLRATLIYDKRRDSSRTSASKLFKGNQDIM